MVAGNIHDLGWAIQTTKGTASAASIQRSGIMGGGLNPAPDIADVEESSGARLRNTAFLTGSHGEGEPVIAARPNIMGILLYGAMGAKAVTGAGDPWTHTFTLAATQPYLTVWRNIGIGAGAAAAFERYIDTKVTRLQLESQAGGVLAATVGVLGINPQFKTAAEATAAIEATEPFLHTDMKGQFLVETVAASGIRHVTINMTTGVTGSAGDDVIFDTLDEGMQEITIVTEQTITDWALWNRFHYGTASPADNAVHTGGVVELAGSGLDVKWSKRTAARAVATPERSLQVTATRVQIAAIEGPAVNTDGAPLTRSVTYKIYQPASGSGLTAILKNGVTAYTPN